MVLLLHPEIRAVEAFSFWSTMPPVEKVVYLDHRRFIPKHKKELNDFLGLWLNNLIAQQHGKAWQDGPA